MATSIQHNPHLATQLIQELYARYTLSVSPTWLSDFLITVRNPPPPLPALASTANFRLLNSDFTQSLATTNSTSHHETSLLPGDIADVNTKHAQLQSNIPVQVLAIIDVGASKYAQIEAIERVERGEEIRGREVIRNVPGMDEEGGATGQMSGKKSAGPHKLLLQDAAGTKVWGFEIGVVPRVFVTINAEDGGMQIGAKVLLRKGVIVRRGIIMLEPGGVTVLGGKVEEWDRKWRIGRKQRLIEELKRENEVDE